MEQSLYIDWSNVFTAISLAIAAISLLRAEQAISAAKEANKLTRENTIWNRQAKLEIVSDQYENELRMPQRHDESRDEFVYFTLRNNGPAVMRNLRCTVTTGIQSPYLLASGATLQRDEVLKLQFPMNLPLPWPKGSHQKVPADYPDSDLIRLDIQFADDSASKTQTQRCYRFTHLPSPWPGWRAQPVIPCSTPSSLRARLTRIFKSPLN